MVDFRFENAETPQEMTVGVESEVSIRIDLVDIPILVGQTIGEECNNRLISKGRRARIGVELVNEFGDVIGRADTIACFSVSRFATGRRFEFNVSPGQEGEHSIQFFAQLLGTDVSARSRAFGVDVIPPDERGGGDEENGGDQNGGGGDFNLIRWVTNNPGKAVVVGGATAIAVTSVSRTATDEVL